ncbi:NACHT domain-containing protein [Chryseobacterium indologenes]|uniref:hypothetical protein n=1 Tax=Chryseobacterium indologenes TaxID=253 RepID=UPI0016259464|nr:hypothetical protein [Chryseobacterium indologenes]
MKINRQELLENLYTFSLGGNGLVVGMPGIGKSYLLQKLKEKLLENHILCFIIRIDNAFDSNDEAIQAELGIDNNWIETLNSIKLQNENKAVLIFDAFDAARDEEKRSGFLKQINKARVSLQKKWNIIVSVRTYDAEKSIELSNLFGHLDNSNGNHIARKITINELTEKEILDATLSHPILSQFYLSSTIEFKKILHIPFFLKILENILLENIHDDFEEIKHYKSETELLDLFWKMKIDNVDKDFSKLHFLQYFTDNLVKNKTLSISKKDLIQKNEIKDLSVLSYFLSEDILEEVSLRKSRIAYSHNIFFDYAINRLCLDHNYKSLIQFISEDYSRAFFFRPSFIYFFTSIWNEDKKIFWELYDGLTTNKNSVIQLFVRLVINGTISSQYENLEDIQEVLKMNGTPEGNERIQNLLQSIQFMRNTSLSQDIELLKFLSKNLQQKYIFEFSFLLERGINNSQHNLFVNCGEAARNLLSYILKNRNTANDRQFLDIIGFTRGIELVAKTFMTSHSESEELIRKILLLINEHNFEIGYFSNLAEHLNYFVDIAPNLVADIYSVIFNHKETSYDKTQLATSVVMNFSSNRKQDFSLCYFKLDRFFPTFLESSPTVALIVGVQIVNNDVIDEKPFIQPFTFKYDKDSYLFYPDHSSIWSEGNFRDKTGSIANHIISYLKSLFCENKNDEAKDLVRIFISNSKVGFLWKLLMQLASEYPQQMLDLIFPLLISPQFISALEVSYEVRLFLDKANALLSDEQIIKLEETVFSAYSHENEYSIRAFLSVIGPTRLQSRRAKDLMKNDSALVENIKPFKFSSSVKEYTTEDWLEDKGVDITDKYISNLVNLEYELQSFNSKFLNSSPSYKDYSFYLKKVFIIWDELDNSKNLSDYLKFALLNTLSKSIAIFTRNLAEIPPELYPPLKTLVLEIFNYNSEYDSKFDGKSAANGYSPTPRVEISEAIPRLYLYDGDSKMLDLYKSALLDNDPVVRYYSIKELPIFFEKDFELYKTLLFNALNKEQDQFNFSVLISSIFFKREKIQEQGEKIVETINKRMPLFNQKNQFATSYAELLLWLLQSSDSPIAFKTLIDGYEYTSFSNAVIFVFFKKIKIYDETTSFHDTIAFIEKGISIMSNYIKHAGNILINTKDFSNLNKDVTDALTTIDEIVMRLYFALDINQYIGNNFSIAADHNNRRTLYFLIKPLIQEILFFSSSITETGLILGHTAHYLVQTLNGLVSYDARDILSMTASIMRYSRQVGYSLDSYSIREIVSLTEKLLADHRLILKEDKPFQDLLSILETQIQSGWVEALALLWRLDEVFK